MHYCGTIEQSATNKWAQCLSEPSPHEDNVCEKFPLLTLPFSEKGPFCVAAAKLASLFELSRDYGGMGFDSNDKMWDISPYFLEGEAEEMELGRIVFSACGPLVREIVVLDASEDTSKAKCFVEQFLPHVFQYCGTVEVLTFRRCRAPLTKWGTASSLFARTLRTV